jgi:flavin reductase (DIM6/NTAB) family NADH-FMN oxidoreductase RutF
VVMPPRVKGAPIHLECVLHQIVELPHEPGDRNRLVIGRVVGVHIDDSVLNGGLVDATRVQPIARLGYAQYCRVEQVFTIPRPR